MCTDTEAVAAEELNLIRVAFGRADLDGGLNEFGMLEFASDDASRAAWGRLARRVRDRAGTDFVSCWHTWITHAFRHDWYAGWTNAAVAEELGCRHPGQISHWLRDGIPLDHLLSALYLTGNWERPLPRPSAGFVRRLVIPSGMRLFSCLFRQAGQFAAPCPPVPATWQVELLQQIVDRHGDWAAVAARARAAPGDERVTIYWPLANATVEAALAALQGDGTAYTGADLDPLKAMLVDRRRTVRECIRWLVDPEAYYALQWTVNALEDEQFAPRATAVAL